MSRRKPFQNPGTLHSGASQEPTVPAGTRPGPWERSWFPGGRTDLSDPVRGLRTHGSAPKRINSCSKMAVHGQATCLKREESFLSTMKPLRTPSPSRCISWFFHCETVNHVNHPPSQPLTEKEPHSLTVLSASKGPKIDHKSFAKH